MRVILGVLGTVWMAYACVKEQTLPVKSEIHRKKPEKVPVEGGTVSSHKTPGAAVPEAVPEAVPAPECIKPNSLALSPPVFLKSVVVTRIARPCTAGDGQKGYEKGTAWVAMGFPCTGGGGRLDWQGHYHNPNIVTFPITNTCPMAPKESETVAGLGEKELGLDATAKLVAYYPFGVQFWELQDFEDADTGYQVSLRTAASLKDGWKNFRDNKGLAVRLYGRENVWVKGGGLIFAADGHIVQLSQKAFKFVLNKVEVLEPAAVERMRAKCESLVPPRNCRDVFEGAE